MTGLRRLTMGATCLLCLATGCIRTINPICTDEQAIFDIKLLGVWEPEKGRERWVFSRAGEKKCKLVYSDGNGRGSAFEARLARVGEHIFLDLYPEEPEIEGNDFYKLHLVPVHTFALVTQIEPNLEIRFPSPDWFMKRAKSGETVPAYSTPEDVPVLTDSTEAIQQFWCEHISTDTAYNPPRKLKLVRYLPFDHPLSGPDRNELDRRLRTLEGGMSDGAVCRKLGFSEWPEDRLGSVQEGIHDIELGDGHILRLTYAPKRDGGGFLCALMEDSAEEKAESQQVKAATGEDEGLPEEEDKEDDAEKIE